MVKGLSTPLSKASSIASSSGRSIDAFLRFMGLSNDTYNAKGNKGRAASQRRLKFLGSILVVLVCVLGVVHLIFPGQTHRVIRHAKKLRPGHYEDSLSSKSGGPHRTRSAFTRHQVLDFIVSGKLNLIDLQFDRREMTEYEYEDGRDASYEGVYGIFCKLNFQAHKDDPSGVPMFRDLVGKSPLCDGDFDPEAEDDELGEDEEDVPRGRIRVDLKHVREMARKAEERDMFPETHNLKLTGVAFHESRCGSTLVANSLIAMNPEKHRVYSESAPPLAALNLCSRALEGDEEQSPCTVEQGAKILQDVLYFMGRSQDPLEERFFLKIQSAGTRYLEIFQRAFPTTPWIFVYRDPVQVLMSHFALGKRSANCLRSMRNPPPIVQRLAEKKGYLAGPAQVNDDEDDRTAGDASTKRLSREEYCAAHLATLTETAADHISRSNGMGQAVNYVNLPHVMYEKVLPAWGVSVSSQEIANIKEVSGHYSKGREGQAKEWKEDSTKKEKMATPEIQAAAQVFLQESYDILEELSSR